MILMQVECITGKSLGRWHIFTPSNHRKNIYQGYKADKEGRIDPLIILIYFDWMGNRTELKEYNEKIKQACGKFGVHYLGIYGPMNLKWNYVNIFETDSFDRFLQMGRQVPRHPKMPHHIAEILFPQEI